MGIEIERKFRVTGEAWRAQAHHRLRIAQAYLNHSEALAAGREHCSVRVRITGESANLNIKSRETGASRQEFEYPIPLADAESLMLLACEGRIEKVRHLVQIGGHLWEIDEFAGDNAGLVVAEIELGDVNEPFARPDWLGPEVTDSLRYYNMALAARPYRHWTAEEKSC
ncbi:CYTH domain-containing protein [Arenimonas sp. GDDSR-1]|uniref:CYTH domain-containing protein n=1 Tax=Arenimonas sp. GDDSR-1 TaxID=2950125 RepID=UPI0026218B81|nr:CYTH domain-containing protein [Arenimonas sp. GDDSR-1]